MTFNLSVILSESARAFPDKSAVLFEGGHLTYRELDEQSDRVAANLAALGIGPGDAVGMQLPNIAEFPVLFFGILKSGAAALPMNVLNKAPEVQFYLTDARARVMVTTADSGDEGFRGGSLADVPHIFVLGDTCGEKESPRRHDFSELLREPKGQAPLAQLQPNDVAVLLYTSGTTGRPKGVELTHFQLYMNARAHVEAFAMDSTSTVVAVMPLFHALGLSGILNAAICAGGAVALLRRFDVEKVLETIQEHRATVLHGVPTMYHALLNHPDLDSYDITSLKQCGSAGAPIAADLLDRLEKKLDINVLEMYGLTESGPLATYNAPWDRRAYSIGKPIWGTEVQVWGDDNTSLPPGKDHIGELVIRGHNTMRGYLDNEQATEEAYAGGWLHTGDLGYQDEDGFLFVVDRKKEMIIRGGYNVYPREVEEALYGHPAVDEVAVVGVPNERLGEEIKAFVTLRSDKAVTEQELIDFAKQQVAAYKYPRTVEILDVMPKGPTGKILKKELKSG